MTIKLDVLIIQIINIGILYWLLKKFVANMLVSYIQEKREQMRKLHDAQSVYQEYVDQGEAQKAKLIEEGKTHKQHLMQEATTVVEQAKEKMMEKAQHDADAVVKKAHDQVKVLEKDLADNREKSVKHTAQLVVKKLFKQDRELQSQYLDSIISEMKQS